jgi:hypothetical protein
MSRAWQVTDDTYGACALHAGYLSLNRNFDVSITLRIV